MVLMYVGNSFLTVGPDIAIDLGAKVLRLMAGTFSVLATLLKSEFYMVIILYSEVYRAFTIVEALKNNTRDF